MKKNESDIENLKDASVSKKPIKSEKIDRLAEKLKQNLARRKEKNEP